VAQAPPSRTSGLRSPSRRVVFCGREPTKTVAVRFTLAGDDEAGADDSSLSTGEWARNLVDGPD